MSEEKPIEKPRAVKLVYNLNDDYRTPRYLVSCLDTFIFDFMQRHNINRKLVVYCPFDTEESEYVRYFKENGAEVIHGDIKTGQDFFENPIPECDLVISNPPFSRKREIFSKLFAAGIPFALLMNLQAMQYQEMGQLFVEEQQRTEAIQFIIPDKKVSFDGHTSAFCSGYYCWKFVEKTSFVHLPHNNSGKFYVPAYSLTKQGDVQ
ncbi:MAG: hypothetical protein J6A75_00050 [Lachnospiraceae bacterium]|nr:hypothetical protein [Lachnospiraceae bacterium]